MNTTNADYFTFNAHNTMLLIGQSGSGKSYLAHKLIDRFTTAYSPNDLKLALFDMKQVEFVRPEDVKPEYLLFDVVIDPEAGLGNLEELVDSAKARITEGTKSPLVFIYIEECDMAALDHARFERALTTLNKLAKDANMKIVYSTSHSSPNIVSDKLAESFELILAGELQDIDRARLNITDETVGLEKYSFLVKER